MLCMHYGFIDSGVTVPHDPGVTIHTSSKTLHIVCHYKSSTMADLSPTASYFISFLLLCPFVEHELVSIPQVLTDTTLPSVFLPNPQFYLSSFYSKGEWIHLLVSRGASSPRWQLVLPSAITAIKCLQYTDKNLGDIVSFLVQLGQPFHTHHHCDQILPPIYRYPPVTVISNY